MRATFTFFLLLMTATLAWAQPANDECVTATPLVLNPPSPCSGGNSTPGVSTFSFSNNGATATTPYPTFSGCNPGGQTDGPAAEVWFTFDAVSNVINISVAGGLSTPNIVLLTGSDCFFLNPVACASANFGAGSVALNQPVTPGEIYYLLISGGYIVDQGDFTMQVASINDCNPCLLSSDFTASPPPQNGTYSSSTPGSPTTVTFCYTVNQWDLTGTIEWLHAVEIELGSGWDASTLTPTVFPPNCPAGGQWGFYDSWTSCNTGQTFGPGFAYESGAGVGCGGSPFDGNPGNNWGYGGGGCENIGSGSPPLTFCFSVSVATCPPNMNGSDLSVSVNPLSDGDSGSWNQTGCNSGTTFNFLGSAICCDDPPPLAFAFNASCAQATNGSIEYQGGLPGETYNLFVFNQGGSQLAAQAGALGTQVFILNNLAPGTYTVVATNVVSGCNKQIDVVVGADPPPVISADNTGPYCPGQTIQLSTDQLPGPGISFSWTGPGNFTSSDPNPVIPNATSANSGVYSLTVNINGCPADASTSVVVENVTVIAEAMPMEICAGETATLTATGNAASYDWGPLGTGTSVTTPPLFTTTTFTVTAQSTTGCTNTGEVTVVVNPLPVVEIQQPPPACEGQILVLQATPGLTGYQWSTGDAGSFVIAITPTGPTQNVSVMAMDPVTGCTDTDEILINVNPQPTGVVTPSTATVCEGETVTLTASGGNNYNWSDGGNGAVRNFMPAGSTIYSVTLTDVAGCRDTVDVPVFVDEPLDAPQVSCGPDSPSSVTFTWPDVPGAAGYTVEVLTGQTGTLSGTTFTVNGLAPGEEVTVRVIAQSDNECPDSEATFTCSAQDCVPIDVAIDPMDDLCLDAALEPDTLVVTVTGGSGGSGEWSGPGIIDSLLGVFDPVLADTGAHDIIYTYTEGLCDYRDTLTINVFAVPTADFTIDNGLVCINDSVFVSYAGSADTSAIFNWDFGGGTADPDTIAEQYFVNWAAGGQQIISLIVEENGCLSEVFADTVDVQEPLPPPAITCGTATTTSTEFTWDPVPGATGYNVEVLTGQSGTLAGTTYTVGNLQPGEAVTIRVTAETDSPCGPSTAEFTCNAADCPVFTIDIDPVPDICLNATDQSLDLVAAVSGGDGAGALIWSGPGITDAALGTFDPAVAGVGAHTITATYVEGPCSGSNTLEIHVFATPTGDFTIGPPVLCINDEATITYNGTATPGATYTWNFNGGTATPGTGAGPHTVSWATPGAKNVTLVVSENGCTSGPSSSSVTVEAPLPAPLINCNTTVSEIVFTWNDVPGAIDYLVEVLTGQSGVQDMNTYTVSGLTPGEAVTIRVTAVGNGPCGDSFAEETCIAEDCPAVTIDFDLVDPICLDATAAPVTLNATVTGGAGGGTESWSGPGITAPAAGEFDPTQAGVGVHTINLNYQEGNCTYNNSFQITVNEQPTADFTADTPICVDGSAGIIYTGSASAAADYLWDFAGGTATPGTGAGPHTVEWIAAGTYTLRLTVTENDCASDPFEQTVTVDELLVAPEVSCNTTNTSVEFSWDPVAGADSYDVSVLQGPAGTLTGTTYLVDDLNPGDEVIIEVTAVSGTACGDVTTEVSCIALDCPDVTLTIDPLGDRCLDSDPVQVDVSAAGGTGGGGFVWTGPGISSGGLFDPALAGVGTHTLTVTYTEGVCSYTGTVAVTVHAVPTADFTLESPICLDAATTVTYTGTAGAGALYAWDFDGGDATGSGAGPYTVSWTDGGAKTITLTVTENGCDSDVFSQTVTVEEPLAVPVLSCASTSTSVTFSWEPVPGAFNYEVNGPAGVLSGTTYTVSDLSPGDEVTLEVVVVGEGVCGNSSAEISCVAQDCPPLSVGLTGPEAVCAGSTATLTFTINSNSDGPFTVNYLANGEANTLTHNGGTQTLDLDLTETTVFEITAVTDQSLPDCVYPGAAWTVTVSQPVNAGTALAPVRVCEGENEPVSLGVLLSGADAGGQWSESSVQPSTGGAFDAGAGTFNPAAQAPGTYTFVYTLDAADPCPDAATEVTVVIESAPVADAGPDQELTCNMGMVSLGGPNTSTGPGITYLWTVDDPGIVLTNPNQPLTDASQAGVYTLTVTNDIGCSSSDEVTVTADFSVPVAALSFSGVSCFQSNDGFIRIDSVSGGTPPYQYSLNDGPFGTQTFYSGLSPDLYTLVIRDANGCISQLDIDLSDEPEELIVTLTTNLEGDPPVIERGDSLQLQAVFNPGVVLDTILWQPDSIGMGNATAVWVSPDETSVYSVTIIDENGCTDSDRTTVIVQKNLNVYIPNAFSPDNDGINDVLFIQAGPQVREVRSFAVFNRWGESMIELFNFQPNDPANGWNGDHRGQPMNPGVYVYYAEIEFTDGTVEVVKGDVLLMR